LLAQLQGRLQAWGLPVTQLRSVTDYQAPRRQRSSLTFFPDELSQLNRTFGPAPSWLLNEAQALQRSQSIGAKLDDLKWLPTRLTVLGHQRYRVHCYPQRRAIKVQLPPPEVKPQLERRQCLEEALKKEVYGYRWQVVDLSHNHLQDSQDDNAMAPLVRLLAHCSSIRVLRLSHNRFTEASLALLLQCLQDKPSVRYLLLDHNAIHGATPWLLSLCDSSTRSRAHPSQVERAGLLHLDLSMNYLAPYDWRQVTENRWLWQPQQNQQTDNDNGRLLQDSRYCHSVYSEPMVSLLDQRLPEQRAPHELIHGEKSAVAIIGKRRGGLSVHWNSHALLMIEQVHPEMGQRELLVAELLVDKQQQIQIHCEQTSPTAFWKRLSDYGHYDYYLAFLNNTQLAHLFETIDNSRNSQQMRSYRMFPGPKKRYENCILWAKAQLEKVLGDHQTLTQTAIRINPSTNCQLL
jgi:hypothetical protein